MKSRLQVLLYSTLPLLALLSAVGCGGRSSTPQTPAEGDVARFIAENPEFADASEDSVEQLNADE